MKQKRLPITYVTRIVNDRGPLPLIRVFTRDPKLVSYLITNGISIGYTRYKVKKSRTRGRPLPRRTCLTYHTEKKCTKTPACYKCGEAQQSYTCKVVPNGNYCGTCRKQRHRTAAFTCPFRPLQNQQTLPEKYSDPKYKIIKIILHKLRNKTIKYRKLIAD